jgi:hypothetical protein
MVKKLILLAVSAAALAGLVTATAQATSTLRWADKGVHLAAGTNPTITMTGKMKYSNATFGGTECPVKAEVTLTGGSSTAHINELVVTNTAECVLNGATATSCVKLIGHEVTGTTGKPLNTANGGAWAATGTLNAGVASIDILSQITIHTTYEPKPPPDGALCIKKVTLESTATAKPTLTFDSANAATKATLGGTLTLTNGESGVHLGNINITGTLTIAAPNSGTYGIT